MTDVVRGNSLFEKGFLFFIRLFTAFCGVAAYFLLTYQRPEVVYPEPQMLFGRLVSDYFTVIGIILASFWSAMVTIEITKRGMETTQNSLLVDVMTSILVILSIIVVPTSTLLITDNPPLIVKVIPCMALSAFAHFILKRLGYL